MKECTGFFSISIVCTENRDLNNFYNSIQWPNENSTIPSPSGGGQGGGVIVIACIGKF